MSRYDGLIIPRSYSEYINKTDAATLQQALQLSGVLSGAVAAGDNKAVKSSAVDIAINDFNTAIQNRIDELVLNTGDSPIEVVDARVSSNGTVYTTLKNRLDAENSILNEKLASLTEGDKIPIITTWETGYLKPDGTIQSPAGYKTSSLIKIPKGYALLFNAYASASTFYWGNYDEYGSFINIGLKGKGKTLSGIKIDAINDRYVKLCSNADYVTPDVAAPYLIKLEENEVTPADAKAIIGNDGIITFENKYVSPAGTMGNSNVYRTTSLIYLQKGQTIQYDASGSDNAALLSEWTSDNNFVNTIYVGNAKYKRIQYTANDDMFVKLCTKIEHVSGNEAYIPLEKFSQIKLFYKDYRFKNQILRNKKILVMGDSLIAGNKLGNDVCWTRIIEEKTGAVIYNYGINGNAISQDPNCMAVRYANIAELPTADIIIIEGGANDKNQNAPIGTNNDSDITTYKGAINVLINGLRELNPKATILFMTTYSRYLDNNNLGLGEKDYADAMLEICRFKGVPVFDNYGNSGLTFLDNNLKSWCDEGIYLQTTSDQHFSPAAYEYLEPRYRKYIESFI